MGIKRLKSGKRQLTFTLNGVKKRVSFDTEKEAKDFYASVRLGIVAETVIEKKPIELAIDEYCELKGYKKNGEFVSPGAVYDMAFTRLVDHLGGFSRTKPVKYVSDVRKPHILKLRERLNKPLAPASVNLYLRIYRGFFNYALDMEWHRINPTANIPALECDQVKKKNWADWQQDVFIESFSGWMRESLYFFRYVIIRPISIFRIQWKHFSPDYSWVNTISYKSRGGRKYEVDIAIVPAVAQFLIAKRIRDRADGFGNDEDFVFHQNGKQGNVNSFNVSAHIKLNSFKEKDSSFDGLTVYRFRHTGVSKIWNAHGLDIASKAAGHRSRVTTERHYVEGEQRLIASAVSSAFNDAVDFESIGRKKRVAKLVGNSK